MHNSWRDINSICDLLNHLIAIEYHINVNEHSLYVIGGLDHNYSSLVGIVSYKRREINLNELFSTMRTHEKELECMGMSIPSIV